MTKFKCNDIVRCEDKTYTPCPFRVVRSRIARGRIFYDLASLRNYGEYDGYYEDELYLDPFLNGSVMKAIRDEK